MFIASRLCGGHAGPACSRACGLIPPEFTAWGEGHLLRLRAPDVLTLPANLLRMVSHPAIADLRPAQCGCRHDKISWSEPYLTSQEHIYDPKWKEPSNGYQDRDETELLKKRLKQAKKKRYHRPAETKCLSLDRSRARPVTECVDAPDMPTPTGDELRASAGHQRQCPQSRTVFLAVGLLKPQPAVCGAEEIIWTSTTQPR